MLTKVIITAASGNAGCGRSLALCSDRVGRCGGVFFGVIERGLVAVVAVGNDELFVGHGGDEQADDGGIADAPDAVQNAVFVGNFGVGGTSALIENLLNATGRIGVEHEDLAEVGVGGLEQVEAIAFWLGEGLLVAENDLLSVLVELAEGDETAPFLDYIGAGDAKALGVGKDAGIFFLDQDGLVLSMR